MTHAAHVNGLRWEEKRERRGEGRGKERRVNVTVNKNPYEHINTEVRGTEFEDPIVMTGQGNQKLSELSTDFEALARYLNFSV